MNEVYWIHGPAAEPETTDPTDLSGPGYQTDPAAGLSGAGLSRNPLAPTSLAIVLCPRGGRHLPYDLADMKRAGVETVVSLLTEDQVAMLDLAEEPVLARRLGMEFLNHPIRDHHVPHDLPGFRAFVADLAERFRRGEKIGIHCWGSVGRAPLTAACTLIHVGWEPRKALAAIEGARGCPIPDTEEQEAWVLAYEANP